MVHGPQLLDRDPLLLAQGLDLQDDLRVDRLGGLMRLEIGSEESITGTDQSFHVHVMVLDVDPVLVEFAETVNHLPLLLSGEVPGT